MFIVHFFVGLFKSIKQIFLKILGHIKITRYPLWIEYSPHGYKIRGKEIRRFTDLLKPGDVVVRRYDGFIVGWFIPGRFSHSGVYVGDNTVVHAMGDGVQKIDIIDFLRCDGAAILRSNKTLLSGDGNDVPEKACKIALSYVGYSYDYDFDICEDYENQDEVTNRTKSVYCHELTRSCFPDLQINPITPKIWNGMFQSKKKQFLAQSFIDSPDMTLIYDTDFSDPI